MRDRVHLEFIKRPISGYLQEAVDACSNLGHGIENHAIIDYVMQTCFLKMTGASEQKMKCICWEIATDDYEFRYDWLKGGVGEYSKYDEKQSVYKSLLAQMRREQSKYELSVDKHNEIIQEVKNDFEGILESSPLSLWADRQFNDAKAMLKLLKPDCFADGANLLVNTKEVKTLSLYKDHLYPQRNRCAHNTLSYQQNLPSFMKLANPSNKYENYYMWFVLLMLMDCVFRRLFDDYCKL